MRYELTPRDELYARISKFQRQLQNQSIEAALIQENSDLFYFSGTIQRSILFIPSQGEPILAVSGNLQRAGEESRLKYIVPLDNQRQLDKLLTDFDLAVSGRIGLISRETMVWIAMTRRLPTTTASATFARALACSGLFTPNPTATGRERESYV